MPCVFCMIFVCFICNLHYWLNVISFKVPTTTFFTVTELFVSSALDSSGKSLQCPGHWAVRLNARVGKIFLFCRYARKSSNSFLAEIVQWFKKELCKLYMVMAVTAVAILMVGVTRDELFSVLDMCHLILTVPLADRECCSPHLYLDRLFPLVSTDVRVCTQISPDDGEVCVYTICDILPFFALLVL